MTKGTREEPRLGCDHPKVIERSIAPGLEVWAKGGNRGRYGWRESGKCVKEVLITSALNALHQLG